MSNAALTWAREVRGISATQKLVLLVLADAAREDSAECWPGVDAIAADACLSDRATRQALRDLEAAKLIQTTERRGRHNTSRYTLMVGANPEQNPENRNVVPLLRVRENRNVVPENRKLVPENRNVVPENRNHVPPNPKEPKRTQRNPNTPRARDPVVTLPGWLPGEAWAEWCAYRLKLDRKTWTQKAAELTLRELTKLRDQGQDPAALIDQAIMRGWRGIYPLKDQAQRVASGGGSKLDWIFNDPIFGDDG